MAVLSESGERPWPPLTAYWVYTSLMPFQCGQSGAAGTTEQAPKASRARTIRPALQSETLHPEYVLLPNEGFFFQLTSFRASFTPVCFLVFLFCAPSTSPYVEKLTFQGEP